MGHLRIEHTRFSGSPAARVFKLIGLVILGIIAAAALAILFGLVIQWLWNALMPDIFGLPELSYWQAVGITVLAHILFGHHNHGHSDHSSSRRRKKSDAGTVVRDYEFDSFREFWNDHGREAFQSWLHGEDDNEEN